MGRGGVGRGGVGLGGVEKEVVEWEGVGWGRGIGDGEGRRGLKKWKATRR